MMTVSGRSKRKEDVIVEEKVKVEEEEEDGQREIGSSVKKSRRSSLSDDGMDFSNLNGAEVVLCDFCQVDISSYMYIRCEECPGISLCLHCFAEGRELEQNPLKGLSSAREGKFRHRKSHAYRIIDHVVQPIFEKDWSADEELLLLEGIEQLGLGNWQDVVEHMGGNEKNRKSQTRCEAHYHGVYLNSKCSPLPDPEAPLLTPETYPPEKFDQDFYLAFQSSSPNSSVTKSSKTPKITVLADLASWIPKRDEFSNEYENEFEKTVMNLEFDDSDPPHLKQLKLKLFQGYNRILDLRYEMKRFVIDRNLMLEPNDAIIEIMDKSMMPLARFYSTLEEFEKFAESLKAENHHRKIIERLLDYRENGVRVPTEERMYLEVVEKGGIPDSRASEIHGPLFEPLLAKYYPSNALLSKQAFFHPLISDFYFFPIFNRYQVRYYSDRIF